LINGLLKDLRFGARTLARSPGFTFVSLLTLAIGVGATTAIFSFVDSALLKPLPYPDADRIVRVLEKPPGFPRNGISTLTFLDWQHQNTVFDYLVAQTGGQVTLTGRGEPVQLRAGRVGAHYFDALGMKAILGRTFAGDEDQLGKEKVAVISHALWLSRFGGDPGIIGRTIELDGEAITAVGVLPGGGTFDRSFNEIWLPLAFKPENMTRNFHWFGSTGKLKRGVSLATARADMDAIGARIAQQYPDSNKGWGVVVEPFADVVVDSDLRLSLYVLLAAVGMVLLIGCANLANLMLLRGAARSREIALRSALGAGRARVVRQFLTESVMLSCAGGLLGLGLGYAIMAGLKAALPPYTLPAEVNVTMDARVLVFALAISMFTGILFGMAPALNAARADLLLALKEGGGGTVGGARHRLRDSLVMAEVALAFVLLTGAGLLIRSFFQMQQADPGFDSTNVFTAGLPLSDKRYPDPARLNSYLRQIQENLQALPGVRDAAFTSAIPMQGWGYGMPFQIAGRPVVDRANRQPCFFKMISPSYFRAVGMHMRRGRGLSDRDVAGAPPVTVVNETMARKYFPNQNPIGQRVLVQQIIPGKTQLGPEVPWEVVGVVADERVTGFDNKRDNPGIYVTTEQSPVYFGSLVVRASIEPTRLEKAIRAAVANLDKDQPLTDVKTLEQIKTQSLAGDKLRSLLLGVFAGIALLLSLVGIYGVISYSVAERTSEIGIRAALGATRANLLRLTLSRGLRMMAIGLAIGFLGAFGLTRLLATLLFGVGTWDPLTIAAVTAALACFGLLACYFPARRATRVDPLIALRYE
jgi:putative ABC transport system permease protein